MEGDIHGVRITPSVILFDSTVPGTLYSLNVTVKNVGSGSRSIRYYGPKSKHFQLKVKNPENPVASGLCVPAVVEYQPTDQTDRVDRLVVTVDGNVIEVPIMGYPTRPTLELTPEVDYGNILANSKVIAREITLVNSGTRAGEFKIEYAGNKPIAIIPSQGSVPPNSVQILKVEFVSKHPGTFEEIASVYLEGREPSQLLMRGHVVKPALQVLGMKDEHPISCLAFGNTYYGTDRTECAILFNNGPEVISFVAIIDEDAIAQELGVDLTQTTTACLAEECGDGTPNRRGSTNEIVSLVTAIPNQGVLRPYQKVPIFFRFSPRWNASQLGWKSQVVPPPRKDFALFIRLEVIGSSSGFEGDGQIRAKGTYAEIALTGTALPVLLDISPANAINFGECEVGGHVDDLCTIRNQSSILPVLFQFRRIAHFSVQPPNGKISPGQTQDVIFSFAPKQVGSFSPVAQVDVLASVADNSTGDPTATRLTIISTLPIPLSGESKPVCQKPKPRFNPGITPYISNEVGMYIETTFDDLGPETPRNAVAGSTKTKLHRLRPRSMDLGKKSIRVAFPNDRAQSVRPTDRNIPYKTLFLGEDRHQYVDPDYAFQDEEMSQRKQHRNAYVEHLHSLRDKRNSKLQKREYKLTNNPTDIGIKWAAGLKPKKLLQDEIKPDPPLPQPPNAQWKLLSTKHIGEAQREALSKPVQEGLNAVPTTPQEKLDCKRLLSPQELHHIIVGPPTLELGQVCLRSVSHKELTIVNNLQYHILVEAQIDCRELRQSSPLSQVVPPRSRAIIPIIFESGTKGNFQRSVSYTINKMYKNHVTVTAEVVPVRLEMSTDSLVLRPSPGLPYDAGFRGVVTLYNKLNYQAEFNWSPNLGPNGTAFSIRPATGTVMANSSLDCEVVWHPAFMSPQDGSFQLMVNEGSSLRLTCQAELGNTVVNFVDSRIIFGPVPVNLTTTRVALLHNSGSNHAYFQVLDPNPFPGLTVTPVHGVIPVGGDAELRVSLTPEAILKFDTRVQVAIKGGKVMELRMGGTVEAPEVDIDVPSFNFSGVYCGSQSIIPFKMINKGNTCCKLEFDLTRFKDFTLKFPGFQTPEDYNYGLMNPGMYSVTLAPREKIEGELLFIPGEVAAYDFILPVTINHLGAPTPAPTPFPPTPAPSNRNSIQHIVNPRPQPVTVATPRKHVIATALRQPLQLSNNRLRFCLPANFQAIVNSTGLGQRMHNDKSIMLVNNSRETMKWGLDLRAVGPAMEEGVLKFLHSSGVPFISDGSNNGIEGELEPGQTLPLTVLFCPKEPGLYEAVVPVVIYEQWDKPYQMLHISGELQEPTIKFDPPSLCLTPVPLLTDVHCEFNILASQYNVTSPLTVETPTLEVDDGDPICPVKVTFPKGNEIKPCARDSGQLEPFVLPCKVTFCSPKPLSFTKPIVFKDSEGRSFNLLLTATADNSILTCYPFLAINRASHTIVREKRNNGFMEAMFVPVHSPNRSQSRPSTSATSSNFVQSSSSYEQTPSSVTDSSACSIPNLRDGAMNKPHTSSDFPSRSQTHPPEAASRLGSAMFPDADSEEGVFHLEVLGAAQRWFSAQGWPGGPFPIIIPDTLRALSNKYGEEGAGGRVAANKKNCKTVYDMISHLSGRPVPGIPINSPLPSDPVERVKQIYWQHSTLLTFLRCQGACLASVRPEYMMTPREFQIWQRLQEHITGELLAQGREDNAQRLQEAAFDMDPEVFEAVSKRAWTDILLQVFKVLILARVTPKTFRTMPLPPRTDKEKESKDKSNNEAGKEKKDIKEKEEKGKVEVNSDPLASNVYSIGERLLLAWLNKNYNAHRNNVWKNSRRGGVPPKRWVVNFELDLMDGLVLAALLGAHMPFLIKTHLEDMYTQPANAEQCLHNALKIVNAMRFAGMDYDVQAVDLTDPNPVMMLLLVVHLFHTLPGYLPKATMEFTGTLHSTVTRQVKVVNPSTKSLTYQILLTGQDARDFSVPKGGSITIPPRQTLPLGVEFTSRYLRSAEATLVLIGQRQGASVGNTLTFRLHTQVDNIRPTYTVKVESPTFELERVMLDVENPFEEAGQFRIVLVESSGDLLDPSKSTSLIKPKEKRDKKVRSKIDHGRHSMPDSARSRSPLSKLFTGTSHDLFAPSSNKKEDDAPRLSAFFSPMSSVYLEANSSTEVEVDFLPFNVGERQCSVIFLNDKIGEFLYTIVAKASLPLPSPLPFIPSCHSVRISSAAAAGATGGQYGGEDSVIYWKCEANQVLKESLLVPLTNMAREHALILAAQQHMSDTELERRHLTGTLMSCSVTSKTTKMLATNPDSVIQQAKAKKPEGSMYVVEYDSDMYTMPEMLHMPSLSEARSLTLPENAKVPKGVTLEDGMVELPVEFTAKKPGHYPCQIVLRSVDDIRVFRIECTVNPEGSTAELTFSVPVHQSIMQEIPVVNTTNHDWHLSVKLEGEGFSGPLQLLAKAYQKTLYPLVFQPLLEKEVKGKLTLTNTDDGQDHVFHLLGKAEKPLALEQINLKCEAKKSITHSVKVPNATKKKLCYRVETDIPFISGKEMVSVLPRQSVNYSFTLSPRMRGVYSGIIAFVASRNPDVEVDSDGDETPQDYEVREYDGYYVWYSVEVVVKPPPPERVIPITCACQKKILIDVIVRNPTPEDITLTATVTGRALSGPPSISLAAGEKGVYTLEYAPAITGKGKGSLIFNNDLVGEFWYELDLDAQSPPPTTLPHLQCELGKWTEQMITLQNPTEETLFLVPAISNSNNFCLVRDNEQPLQLHPHTTLEVALQFMPSTLGQGDHLAKISFHSQQLGEWVFIASGTGLLPQVQDAVSVFTGTGTNTTLLIPFRNPLDCPVLASVALKDHTEYKELYSPESKQDRNPFTLLLKNTKTVSRVGPKSTLEIPVSFAPSEMRKYSAICTVIVTKEDNSAWDYLPTDTQGYPVSQGSTQNGGIREIRWVFPVYGVSELQPVRDWQCVVVQCQARDSVEQRLEVVLSGSVPTMGSQQNPTQPFMVLRAKSASPNTSNQTKMGSGKKNGKSVVVGQTLDLADEYNYELSCGADGMPNYVTLTLVRQKRDAQGLVTLLFNIKFQPFKTMNYLGYLSVTGALGGLWKFPVRFMATDPPVDDVINVEASGLGKLSTVGFRLHSQTSSAVNFKAYFEEGSDSELSVLPTKGKLLPSSQEGTLFNVSFMPSVYGRLCRGKLIIQSPDMQWSYEVRGVIPEYCPPQGRSSIPVKGPLPDRQHRKGHNYVLDNIRLTTTAVSSPIKGAPLVGAK